MTTDTQSNAEHAVGSDGRPLTIADLPPADTKHWSPRRKAQILAAVRGGLLDLEEACDRYMLTVEEFVAWQNTIDQEGLSGFEAKRVNERRRASRKSVEETGKLVLHDQARLDCVITNISSGGARLEVPKAVPLPATIELHCTSSGRSARVSVVWQRGRSVGVRFEATLPVPLFEESGIGAWLVGER